MAVTGKVERIFPPKRSSKVNFSTMKRNAEENFSDVLSDIVITVDGVSFSLHKYPLMSRSGRIRRLLEDEQLTDTLDSSPVVEFASFPGGPDIFELAAKFCYGINFEITTANVGHLRCAAEVLEMTEKFGDENLVNRTEAFLKEVVFRNLETSVEVLHTCEPILALAEEVRLVSRCIDALASKACSEQQKLCSLMRLDGNNSGRWYTTANEHVAAAGGSVGKAIVEWWAEDLSSLRIDLYQRVFAAMKARGLKSESLGGSLMHYAKRSLKGLANASTKQASVAASVAMKSKTRLHVDMNGGNNSPKAAEHEQRIMLETIVSLLPAERNLFPTDFLLSLLRLAIVLDTTVACRLDLERRIGLQLEQATVDDLLIPSFSHAGDTIFDLDVVQRVLVAYLQQEEKHNQEQAYNLSRSSSAAASDIDDFTRSPSSRKGITKVAKLIDMYLAEVAPDPNLKVSKFTSLAEELPSNARVLDDGLYRAIDIFLKAHPTLSDLERRKLCKVLDCQKLSKEACTHAAQNERLPVQMVVQVLYFEQLRMRNAMGGSMNEDHRQHLYHQDGYGLGGPSVNRQLFKTSGIVSPKLDTFSSLRRENQELKQEVSKLQARVTELEKENVLLKQEVEKPVVSGHGNSGRFFSTVSRRLGKMNPFSSNKSKDAFKQPETRMAPRQRRHSVS